MSQENVEVVRKFFEAWNRDDLHAARELCDEEIEIDRLNSMGPDAGIYRGLEEAERFWYRWRDTWEVWHTEIAEYIDAGDNVVALGRAYGRGRGGIPVEANISQVATIQKGEIVRSRLYQTRSEALEAAGLSEQDV